MKPTFHLKAVLLLIITAFSITNFAQTTIFPATTTWSYIDNNIRPVGWPATHNATGWGTGAAPLGYSNGVTTTVSFGGDANNKYTTTYFNKVVNIPSVAAYGSFTINITRDDGAILYVNGREAVRSNMPSAAVAHSTFAASTVGDGAPETQIHTYTIAPSYFVDGNNTFSLELHQVSLTSSDLSFSVEVIGNPAPANVTYVRYNENWKFLDNGTNQGTAWRASGFNDATWSAGHGDFGYSTGGGEATTVSYGPDANNKYVTTYFRKAINIADPTAFADFTLNVKRDDGVVVYINGTERYRNNLTANPTYTTLASNATDNGTVAQTAILSNTFFTAGVNVIAVEIHQTTVNSSDIAFDLELIGQVAATPPTTLMAFGGNWRYLDNNTRPAGWETTGFADGGWATGPAELGYADAPATTVSFGPDGNNKYITTYFRRNVNITGLNTFATVTCNIIRDDGFVMYVNGVEVRRDNLPTGTIDHNTLAPAAIGGADETTPLSFSVCPSYFVEGNNTIAIEMHQNAGNSSDLSFNLEMIGNSLTAGAPLLTRNPYLQMGRQTAITIRWRTDIPSFGRVEIGPSFGNYSTSATDETCATTEHEVTITGLTADTKYFYRVGTTSGTILQGATNNFFTTLPPANTTRKLKFAVFGDCGRNDNGFQNGSIAQYERYLSDNSMDAADGMLLLGDNAYNSGLEGEYITGFFNPFGANLLKNHKLYPAPGNHDYYGTSTTSRTGMYYQNFTMPTNAEIGGVASGTEAFYSYDIGDVHFLALDSYGEETGATKLYDTLGAQVTWIKADLAANTKKWVVAYWHHPPYTKGSHDSDTESDLVAVRENFIRILERNGVDMILCGHSHDYERSYLLKGYYKTNPGDAAVNGVNFNVNTHAVNNSSGKYDGTANSCTYTTASGKVHHGTVYVLSGSSGANGGVVTSSPDTWPHNALPFSIDEGGMFYFEVENNRLDAKFINRVAGPGGIPVIGDQFTIMKDVNVTNNINIVNGNSVNLTASWPQSSSYTWTNTVGTTRTVNVTPPTNATTVYTVSDGMGCVTDQFSVVTSGTLPVSMLSYDVRLNGNKVDITWATATEVNSKDFSIERSGNGVDYSSIGTVAAAGNSTTVLNYAFTDYSPLLGTSYYRLLQTDIDNSKEYLGVRQVNYNKNKNFEVRAIGGTNGTLTLQINSLKPDIYRIRIYDIQGRERKNELVTCGAGTCIKDLILETGAYVYEVSNKSGEKLSQKIIINRQ